jgi:hypothetical protein
MRCSSHTPTDYAKIGDHGSGVGLVSVRQPKIHAAFILATGGDTGILRESQQSDLAQPPSHPSLTGRVNAG